MFIPVPGQFPDIDIRAERTRALERETIFYAPVPLEECEVGRQPVLENLRKLVAGAPSKFEEEKKIVLDCPPESLSLAGLSRYSRLKPDAASAFYHLVSADDPHLIAERGGPPVLFWRAVKRENRLQEYNLGRIKQEVRPLGLDSYRFLQTVTVGRAHPHQHFSESLTSLAKLYSLYELHSRLNDRAYELEALLLNKHASLGSMKDIFSISFDHIDQYQFSSGFSRQSSDESVSSYVYADAPFLITFQYRGISVGVVSLYPLSAHTAMLAQVQGYKLTQATGRPVRNDKLGRLGDYRAMAIDAAEWWADANGFKHLGIQAVTNNREYWYNTDEAIRQRMRKSYDEAALQAGFLPAHDGNYYKAIRQRNVASASSLLEAS